MSGKNRSPNRSLSISGPQIERWAPWSLLLLALVAFSNALTHGFVNYDDWWLVANSTMPDWLTPRGLWTLFFDFSRQVRMEHGAEYLPIRDLSAAIQFSIFGEHPIFYRLVSVSLFGLSAGLLFRFFRDLGTPRDLALMGMALFVVHPIHVESVVWLSGHKDVLSLFFLSAALLSYVSGSSKLALLMFACGLGSKYHVMVFPCFLPVLDRILGRRLSFLRLLPFFVLAGLSYFLVTQVGEEVRYAHINLGKDLVGLVLNSLSLIHTSFSHLLFPDQLQLFYPYRPVTGFFDLRVWSGILLLAGGSILFFKGWKRQSFLIFPLVFFFLNLLPMFRAPQMHLLADRYLLLSSLGFALSLATLLRAVSKRWFAELALVLVMISSLFLTWQQNQVWSSSLSLWSHAASGHKPVHENVWLNLAQVARDGRRWQLADRAYGNLLRIKSVEAPSYPKHLANWAFVKIQMREFDTAEQLLRPWLKKKTKNPQIYMNLGVAQVAQGKTGLAWRNLRKAARLAPKNPEIQFNLARLAWETKRWNVFRFHRKNLKELAPNDPRLAQLIQVRLPR